MGEYRGMPFSGVPRYIRVKWTKLNRNLNINMGNKFLNFPPVSETVKIIINHITTLFHSSMGKPNFGVVNYLKLMLN